MLNRKPTVLVVNDDREIVRGLTIRLRALGCEVLWAPDGERGLTIATERQPDLIILDIRMPGMDGLAVLRLLRKSSTTALIQCIVLSASIAEDAKREALNLGAQRFVEKPFDAERLLTTVKDLLEQASTQPRLAGVKS